MSTLKKVFWLGVALGAIAMFVVNQWPLYEATTSASEPEIVKYVVVYNATIHDTDRGVSRSTFGTEEIPVPVTQPVNEDFFRLRIRNELSNFSEGEVAPSQVFVEVVGIYPPLE